MARRRSTRRKTTPRRAPARRRPAARRPAPKPEQPLVSPETARAIGGVVLLLVGAVLALSLFGAAGPLGKALGIWVAQLFGWLGWAVPLLLFWYGLALLRRVDLTRNAVVGSLLLLVAGSGLLHLLVNVNEHSAALAGTYGGLTGYAITSLTGYAIGPIGTLLLMLALGTIGVFVLTNRPLTTRDDGQPVTTPQPPPAPISATPEAPAPPQPPKDKAPEPDFQPRVVDTNWEQPPLTLLSEESSQANAGDTRQRGRIIEQTLANFNIGVKVVGVNVGPTVTQYELQPDARVKLNQITALDNDLARALAAHPVRIQAPIPNKPTVGIEAPNQKAATVRLRHLFQTPQFKKGGALPLALGLDVSGRPMVTDLATMPHVLIAGQTGSGKSVGINTILMSLLFTHSPKHLRLLLIDPKRVELTAYNGIPHLLAPVVVDPPKVVNALKWVVSEMDRRYKVFEEARVKDLIEYNKANRQDTLPYLVVVIDELADLMAISGKAVEGSIVRIAQLARATGIHLIIATQRPSTNVITGVIKANFPTRMAFTVSSNTDSRVILDTGGADKLLGKGDMLFLSASLSQPVRLQGAFADSQEVKNLTDFLKGKGEPVYDESVTEKPSAGGGEGGSGEDLDPMYDEAHATVIQARKASASFLQRRLGLGYARAARILDQLEENGVIGPGEGAKPRQILVDEEE